MSDRINLFHGDLLALKVSNIPTVTNPADLVLFEQFMKSCTLPEYNLDTDQAEFIGHAIVLPKADEQNVNRSPLQINFKLSEYCKNYLYLYSWMQNLRYGSNITGLARKNVITELAIQLLDNSKRMFGWFSYQNALCVGLSALPLEFGSADEVIFTVMFQYEQCLFDYADPSPESV